MSSGRFRRRSGSRSIPRRAHQEAPRGPIPETHLSCAGGFPPEGETLEIADRLEHPRGIRPSDALNPRRHEGLPLPSLLAGRPTGKRRPVPPRPRPASGWVAYLVLILVALVCLHLLAWPIVRRVILHQDDEVAEEIHGQPDEPADDLR